MTAVFLFLFWTVLQLGATAALVIGMTFVAIAKTASR